MEYKQDAPEVPAPHWYTPRLARGWWNRGTDDDNVGTTQYNETNVSSAQFGTLAGGLSNANLVGSSDDSWVVMSDFAADAGAGAGAGVEKPSVGTTATLSIDNTESTFGPFQDGHMPLGTVYVPVPSGQMLTSANVAEHDQHHMLEVRKHLQRDPGFWREDTLPKHLKAQLTSATPPSSKASRSRVSKASTRSADAQAEAACMGWVVTPDNMAYAVEERARAVPDTTPQIAFAGVQFDEIPMGPHIVEGVFML